MDRRTKILIALFGGVLVYALCSSLVYPQWIKPLLNIDERIAERRREYDELQALEDEVDRAKRQYRAWVARVGSFDVGKVATGIRARVNELIEKHHLQDANISPSRPSKDRRTKLTKMTVTVTAVGKLRSVVGFLTDLAELPQLVRLDNAAIYPVGGSRKGQNRDRVNLRVPIEIMVLPQQRIVGRLDEQQLVLADPFPPRHLGRDYSLIWNRKPFLEPIPLRAEAGRDVTKRQGQSARLFATASGGDGEYTFSWHPKERLSDATIANPMIDTSDAFAQTYTLKVTDSSGETATDNVQVTVQERKVARGVDRERRRAPSKPADDRWPDGKYMQLRMTLLRSTGTQRIDELMVYNNRSKEASYYAVGEAFNGGELVFVHPTGGLVCRKDAYFIYPIGTWLDQDISVDDDAAADFPELRAAADRHRESAKAAAKQAQAAAAPVKEASVDGPGNGKAKAAITGPGGLRPDLQPAAAMRDGKKAARDDNAEKSEKRKPASVEKKRSPPTVGRGKTGTRRIRRPRRKP